MSRGLRWALVVSLLAHLAILLAVRGLSLPWNEAELESEILEAHLISPPLPAPPKPQAKPQKPAPKPPTIQPAQATPAVAPEPPPSPAQASAGGPPEPAIDGAAATATAAGRASLPSGPFRILPADGRIRYSVSKGESKFPVGRAVHEWRVEGERYTLRSTIETTGLVSLFANVKLSQLSRGWVDANGLKPLEFRDERKGGRYRADFDWERGSVLLGTDVSVPVAPGAQDLLSMFYQFSLYPLDGPDVAVMVVTGRKYERYVFKVDAAATVLMGDNEVPAYHLSHSGSDGGIEVWLARDMDRLPIRIRYIDRNGGISELLAEEISFQGMK